MYNYRCSFLVSLAILGFSSALPLTSTQFQLPQFGLQPRYPGYENYYDYDDYLQNYAKPYPTYSCCDNVDVNYPAGSPSQGYVVYGSGQQPLRTNIAYWTPHGVGVRPSFHELAPSNLGALRTNYALPQGIPQFPDLRFLDVGATNEAAIRGNIGLTARPGKPELYPGKEKANTPLSPHQDHETLYHDFGRQPPNVFAGRPSLSPVPDYQGQYGQALPYNYYYPRAPVTTPVPSPSTSPFVPLPPCPTSFVAPNYITYPPISYNNV